MATTAIFGAGVMGAGIAAHCANAGIPVLLLDIVPPKATAEEKKSKAVRDSFATGAIDKLKKAKPAAFTHPRNALLISVAFFAATHTEWLVAALTGLIYSLWVRYTRSVLAVVIAHAVTNAALGIYILKTGKWMYW